jgi:hypothetical protein
MAKVAYCSGCGRYVQLTADGECPDGHTRSSLRDVHDGSLAETPVVSKPAEPAFRDDGGLVAQVIGKGIVIMPVALIFGWGMWSGYEQFSGSGMSVLAKLALSAGSLVLTFGVTYLLLGMRKHR